MNPLVPGFFLALLVCASLPAPVACQTNSTGGYFLIEAVGVNSSSPNSLNVSGANVTLLGTNTVFDLALLPKISPGNSTKTTTAAAEASTTDDAWAWWVWALIGGAGLILIVTFILFVVFYSEFKTMIQGYNKVASQQAVYKDRKVIEVTLVQPGGAYV